MREFNLRRVEFADSLEAKDFMEKYIGCHGYGSAHMSKKIGAINIMAENLRVPACNILKQAMLSLGGEVAVHHDIIVANQGLYPALIMGTPLQFKELIKKLKQQMFGLPRLSAELEELLVAPAPRSPRTIPYNGGSLELGKKTLVMGILNCTPDSFSDGGRWFDLDKAVEHALTMEREGADIIDIGGESTRPGSDAVSAQEEMDRVIPVIKALKGKLKIPMSIDSYKAVTAKAALDAGAHIINDVWGLQRDPDMAKVGAEYKCPIIVMHNKTEAKYNNFMGEVMAFLSHSIDLGLQAGCTKQQFIVDPGFGFGKEREHNLILTKHLQEFSALGVPVLMAASRKKTVGLVLDAPVDQRLEGDAAVTAISIARGADIIRVHDVQEMTKVAKMADAIAKAAYYKGENNG